MRNGLVLVLISVALVVANGCSSSDTNTEPKANSNEPTAASTVSQSTNEKPEALKLVETGYTIVEGPYVEYAFVMKNPNATIGAEPNNEYLQPRYAGADEGSS